MKLVSRVAGSLRFPVPQRRLAAFSSLDEQPSATSLVGLAIHPLEHRNSSTSLRRGTLLLRLALTLLAVLMLAIAPAALAHADAENGGSDVAGGGGGTGSGNGGDGDGGGGGGGGGGGTDGPAGVSVPRVMVESFDTSPGTVQAGQEFELSFTLRNTSSTTRVRNMKVTVASSDAAFLPVAGTSSLFIPSIRPGNYASRTLLFRALPSLDPKPYQVTISLEYEDSQANAYTSSEDVAVVVTQETRASASAPQLMPEMLMVGQQGSLTFNIQNQGRSKLFNAKASIPEGQAITGPEVFVGTIDSGATGAVDMMVTAATESAGPVEILVSYEDDEGAEKSFTQEVQVMAAPMPMPEEPIGPEEPMPEEGMALPWIPILAVAGAALLALIVILVVVRRARHRKAAQADADLLASMDAEPLISED